MLAHLDQNYAFIMRRLDIVLYTISSLLHNRAVATDVPSLCSRNSNRISLVFKLGKKITSLGEKQGRDFYMLDLQFCIAVNYNVQLMWKMAMEVAMHFQVENYNSFCSLQDICAARRATGTDEELGQQNAVINQKAPKNLLYKSQVRKKKDLGVHNCFPLPI